MADGPEDFNVVKERILAEFATQGFGDEALSLQKSLGLREYAKARTDLHSDNLTTEQAIWKSLYDGLTEELRKTVPDTMAGIESLEKRRDDLLNLQKIMAIKMEARPHDFGIRAWWGFVIIGLLMGWMRSSGVLSLALYGFLFWIAGMFFCVFALDSPEVQSKIAIFLHHRLGEERISNWLYHRALTIR